jgi:ectoine hydroxylase-related dioxygenase (phytanoyl-CoA dioxygenase family)
MTTTSTDNWRQQLEEDGYAVLPTVFDPDSVEAMTDALERAFAAENEAALRSQEGTVYAARNVLTLWPDIAEVWRQPAMTLALAEVLGPAFGLVRTLFFDKPPQQTWALPWHKDLTIAVHDNRRPSALFGKPTRKAGVPHVEAPREVLEQMLTARIHLDEVTEENGPLKVIPGSHRGGKELALDSTPPILVMARRGDVLLMRPLLAHCSGCSHPGTSRHRRVLHLEFAASPELPDGYAWHHFSGGYSIS